MSQDWSRLHHACAANFSYRLKSLLLEGADEREICKVHGVHITPVQLVQHGYVSNSTTLVNYIESLKIISRALIPWSPSTQALYPPAMRGLGFFIMLIDYRLGNQSDMGTRILPTDIWILISSFLVRRKDVEETHALGFADWS